MSDDSSYLDQLAEFVSTLTLDRLSDEAVASARDVTMDTVGAIVGGHRLPEMSSLVELMRDRSKGGAARILGTSHAIEPMFATFVNATTGICLEMDEGNRFSAGHPAIHSMPGTLAVAEEMGVSGRHFLEAFVVAYEVDARISRATRTRPGAHSHGHWGAVSTAAGIARLKGYDPKRTREVMSLAASMSPANTWTPCFEGATVRNVYSGRSGLQGVLATHLYDCGFTGLRDGLTDVYGTLIGDYFDHASVTDGLGEGPLRIEQNYFKFHACCRINHPSIDAALDARAKHVMPVGEIKSVRVFSGRNNLSESHLAGMVGPYPSNMLSAKFNIPYAVAVALSYGHATINEFFPEVIDDDAVKGLATRVSVTGDPNLATGRDGPSGPIARVEVELADGTVVNGQTTIVRGDLGNRAPREELVEKFRFLARPIVGDEGVVRALERLGELEELPDIRELSRSLVT